MKTLSQRLAPLLRLLWMTLAFMSPGVCAPRAPAYDSNFQTIRSMLTQPESQMDLAIIKLTMTNIQQNITVALGLKALFLITTVVGLTGLWPAILADTGATVLVTLNALRLLRPSATRTASIT